MLQAWSWAEAAGASAPQPLLPSLINGDDVPAALLTGALLVVSLGLVLLPAWRRRRARRALGRL